METKNPTLANANELYETAKEMLKKPEEDVVPYAIYQKSYEAIMAYLRGFLLENHVTIDAGMEASELLEQCRKIDERFNTLDLSAMKDPKSTVDVWMNNDWAEDFIEITEKTKRLVTN